MYLSFYGLSAAPFRLVVEPSFHFDSREHARAQSYLHYALDRREGFALITGAPGSGKTALMQVMMEALDPERVVVGHVAAVLPQEQEIMPAVGLAFGCGGGQASAGERLARLQTVLTEHAQAGRMGLLVVDEAQNLAPSALESLRQLANLQHAGQALLQVILVGQASLRQHVMSPALSLLAQRVVAVCEIGPLGGDEVQGYVEHRLRAAGCQQMPEFEPEVLRVLHEAGGGNPRAINGLCERLLLLGFLSDRRRFTRADMQAVMVEMKEEWAADAVATTTSASDRF